MSFAVIRSAPADDPGRRRRSHPEWRTAEGRTRITDAAIFSRMLQDGRYVNAARRDSCGDKKHGVSRVARSRNDTPARKFPPLAIAL